MKARLCLLLPFWALLVGPAQSFALTYFPGADLGAFKAFGDMFPETAYVEITYDNGEVHHASGVNISDNAILTAGHIATLGFDEGASFVASFGDNHLTNPGTRYTASGFHVNPFYSDTIGSGIDLGILTFDQVLDEGVAASFYDGAVEKPLNIESPISGYGLFGPAEGTAVRDGNRRAGNGYIRDYGDTVLGISDNYAITWLFPVSFLKPHPLPVLPDNGDSGGGWFLYDSTEGEFELFAISSFVSTIDPDFGFAGAIPVSLGSDWISETLDTIAPIPEPASALSVGLIATLSTLLRRRRTHRRS